MPIPKVIYQTYKSSDLPWLVRWHVWRSRKRNPTWRYEFYDDARVDDFIRSAYGRDISDLYRRIRIGAAKADFFRYAMLYKQGGVYIDIDGAILTSLDSFIRPDDVAVLSRESKLDRYPQWGLIYAPEHPFLARTLEMVLDNLRTNRFPYDVIRMTGPQVYTDAVKDCIAADPSIPHRFLGVDYNHFMFYSMWGTKRLLYLRRPHWSEQQRTVPVLSSP